MIVPEIMRVGFKYIAKTNSGYTAIRILSLIPSPLVIRQGGKCVLESRASTEVYYPIHVTKVLAIQATGTAHSTGQPNYGLGLVARNANSAGFTLLNCSEEAPRYYKEASWIVIGI